MKPWLFTYTCFLICLFPHMLSAQNWQLINPDYHYHYLIYDSEGQQTDTLDAYTVRIDSTDGDTSYLNQWFPEERIFFDRVLVDIYNPHFLQKEMITSEEGEITFRNPGDLHLSLTSEVGANWMFDSTAALIAQLESIYETETYGQQDSVKLIQLSSGDQILLSKSFGILQFPKSYGQGEYY